MVTIAGATGDFSIPVLPLDSNANAGEPPSPPPLTISLTDALREWEALHPYSATTGPRLPLRGAMTLDERSIIRAQCPQLCVLFSTTEGAVELGGLGEALGRPHSLLAMLQAHRRWASSSSSPSAPALAAHYFSVVEAVARGAAEAADEQLLLEALLEARAAASALRAADVANTSSHGNKGKRSKAGSNSRCSGSALASKTVLTVLSLVDDCVLASKEKKKGPPQLLDSLVRLALVSSAARAAVETGAAEKRGKGNLADTTREREAVLAAVTAMRQQRQHQASSADDMVAQLRLVLDLTALVYGLAIELPVGFRRQWEEQLEASHVLGQALPLGEQSSLVSLLSDKSVSGRLERIRWLPSAKARDSGAADETTLYRNFCSVIFSTAAAYASATSERELDALVDSKERASHAHKKLNQEIQRPPLHSRIARISYVFLCAGYRAETVMGSCLCVAATVLDTVHIVGAASLFSAALARGNLPVRVQRALAGDTVTQLLHFQRRAEATAPLPRVPPSYEEEDNEAEVAAERSLAAVLERVSAAGPASRKKDSRVSYVDGGDTLVFVGMHAVTQHVVRGDEANAIGVLQALVPVLLTVGGPSYPRDALACIVRLVQRHLRNAGTLDGDSGGKRSPASLEMEAALESVASFLVPRLCDSFTRAIGVAGAKGKGKKKKAAPLVAARHSIAVCDASAAALVCGVTANVAAPLVSLHAHLAAAVGQAGIRVAAVQLSSLENLELPIERHPQGTAVRTSRGIVNDMVVTELLAATDALTSGGVGLDLVLQATAVLYTLCTKYSVVSEPPALSTVRAALATAAAAVLAVAPTEQKATTAVTLPLEALRQMVVVLCTPRCVHHVTVPLLEGLVRRLRDYGGGGAKAKGKAKAVSPSVADEVLVAAANVCLAGDPALVDVYLSLLSLLGTRLSISGTSHVLRQLQHVKGPREAAAVEALLDRLSASVVSPGGDGRGLNAERAVEALSVLVEYGRGTERDASSAAAHVAVLLHLTAPEALREATLAQCGALVGIAASLERQWEAAEGPPVGVDSKAVAAVPRAVAAHVLALLPHAAEEGDGRAYARALPAVLTGYASISDAKLREQILRVLISRTIRVCPLLAPEEVVQCVEAYCRCGVYHEYLFSVLLARVTDVRQRFSLEHATRLLTCGTRSGDAATRTACLTAARPVFTAHVKWLLQHDPAAFISSAPVSTSVLRPLRECFPSDPCCPAVLETIARSPGAVGVPVAEAALQLIAARQSQDYAALQALAAHVIAHLLPAAPQGDVARLVLLLVQCGVRSAALFAAAHAALSRSQPLRGSTVALLCDAFTRATAELDSGLTDLCLAALAESLQRAVSSSVADDTDADPLVLPLSAAEVAVVLRWLPSVGVERTASLTDDVLAYVGQRWAELRPEGALAAADVEVLLRACVQHASRPQEHTELAAHCADCLLPLLPTEDTVVELNDGQQWWSHLLAVASTAGYLVSMGLAAHPAVERLLGVLYENKDEVLRRQLLLERTHQTVAAAGRSVHAPLYDALVQPDD